MLRLESVFASSTGLVSGQIPVEGGRTGGELILNHLKVMFCESNYSLNLPQSYRNTTAVLSIFLHSRMLLGHSSAGLLPRERLQILSHCILCGL